MYIRALEWINQTNKKTNLDDGHLPGPSTKTLIVLLSQVAHGKFWTCHKNLSSFCWLQRASVALEQSHPLKICPVIWMQEQHFIGRRDTTQLFRSYSMFAMRMASCMESWCFVGQFSIIYQMPWNTHCLCLEDCTCKHASQGNSHTWKNTYMTLYHSVISLKIS